MFVANRCQDPGTPWKGNKRGNLQVGQTFISPVINVTNLKETQLEHVRLILLGLVINPDVYVRKFQS